MGLNSEANNSAETSVLTNKGKEKKIKENIGTKCNVLWSSSDLEANHQMEIEQLSASMRKSRIIFSITFVEWMKID